MSAEALTATLDEMWIADPDGDMLAVLELALQHLIDGPAKLGPAVSGAPHKEPDTR